MKNGAASDHHANKGERDACTEKSVCGGIFCRRCLRQSVGVCLVELLWMCGVLILRREVRGGVNFITKYKNSFAVRQEKKVESWLISTMS